VTRPVTGPVEGLVLVDKPTGWTSHDVVARVRRLAGTRRVGHAGTLDPMASGLLVVGVGRATRLLGHLALAEKTYDATIRLGQATVTDDADGAVLAVVGAGEVTEEHVREGVRALTGQIRQVPSAVSAVKVGGRRSYARVRAGEAVDLPARAVTVSAFAVGALRRHGDLLDAEVTVTCSSGTYVRALARDLGVALGVGGHLTRLRRTRAGAYAVADARTLAELEQAFAVVPLAEAATAAFPRRDVTAEQARVLSHGGRLTAVGLGPGPIGVFAPDGRLLALVEEREGSACPLAVFAG
jgi:tRNA pseudouridine55 synthase